MGLKHFFHSTKADPADPTIIGATKWNADHYYVDGAGAPIGNVGALLLAGAAGALTHLNSVAAGSFLVSAGLGALPAWVSSLPSLTVSGLTTVQDLIVNGTTFVSGGHVLLTAAAGGQLLLRNNAGNDFNLLQFGGTTAAFPALKRTGGNLYCKLADDSAFGTFAAGFLESVYGKLTFLNTGSAVQSGLGTPEGVVALPVGSLFLRQDGGAGTCLYVKQSGAATNTGWVAK